MNPLTLTLVAGGLVAGTGLAALALARWSAVAATIATAGAVAGGIVGLGAAGWTLWAGGMADALASWTVPGGALAVGLDPLAAFFLVPLSVLGAVCAVYGLLRVASFVDAGGGFGVTLMCLGVAGALLGIALALTQRDLKRVLAYSSVENVGVVLLGVGLGFWARAHGDARLAALAFGGGLLHVWNHAAMKGLMFLGAGSMVHGTGTRDIERLGGLLRRMPSTGRAFLLGAVAIAGLPPLNGLTGEWLVYRGLMEVGRAGAAPASLAAMGGAAVLALTGGLAALCFVRLVGVTLLGTPRSAGASEAHESSPAMRGSIWFLAGICVLAALGAPWLVSVQAPVLATLGVADAPAVAAAGAVLTPLIAANVVLMATLGVGLGLLNRLATRASVTETWGCGFAAPTARMQYSGSGFAEGLATRVLPRWLRPLGLASVPVGVFPRAAEFVSDTSDPLTRCIYEPILRASGDRFARLRFLQQGNLHIYLIYVFAAMIVGLVWVVARDGVRW